MARFIENPQFRQLLEQKLAKALEKTIAEFEVALRESIEASVYYWDRITVRTGGRVVSTPRDIKDTGSLLASQVTKRIGLLTFAIGWEVAYAAIVYLGGMKRADGTETPERRWAEVALDNFNPMKTFAAECRAMVR
jgi:phage gpG-like protein